VTIHVLTNRDVDLERELQPFLSRPEVKDVRVVDG
jgi:hypothetical protein